MWTHIRLLLLEQSDLSPHCLSMRLQIFLVGDKKYTFCDYGGGGQGGGGGTGMEGAESGVEGAESGVEGGGKRELRGREEGSLWAGVWKEWRAKLLFFLLENS